MGKAWAAECPSVLDALPRVRTLGPHSYHREGGAYIISKRAGISLVSVEVSSEVCKETEY